MNLYKKKIDSTIVGCLIWYYINGIIGFPYSNEDFIFMHSHIVGCLIKIEY